MNLVKHALAIICLTVLTATSAVAQEDSSAKKYPSLLWEITGPGMDKPSYLFGTMHVSSKVAFYLSDSFFMALKKVDAVGLESRPDEWLPKIAANLRNNRTYYTKLLSRYGRGPLDNSLFTLEEGDLEKILMYLGDNSNLVNYFLYRSNGANSQEFEERTYLDMFIYQSGMKMKKNVVSLEDYDQSDELVTKSYYGPDEKEELSDVFEPEPPKKDNYYYEEEGDFDALEKAYRNGDLDAIDSIEIATSTPHNIKYMLTERNRLMVQKAEGIMKSQTLFIAVGAAHLPGKEGMIEMFRAKGFTLRPVMQKGMDDKSMRKLQKQQSKPELVPFTSNDGFISANFPGAYLEFSAQNVGMISCPDLVNGAHIEIYRHPYHANLFGNSADYVMERLDSFIYTAIPGEVEGKEKIKVNGHPGYEIYNQTRSGTYERNQLIVFPNEIIIVKLGGTKKYVKGKDGKAFFKSLSFADRTQKEGKVRLEAAQLEAKFPAAPWTSTVIGGGYGENTYLYNKDVKSNSYILMAREIIDIDDYTPDTTQLRFALTSFRYTNEFKFVSASYDNVLGRKALTWECKTKDEETVKARAFWRGRSIVIQAVIVRADGEEVTAFWNSVGASPESSKEYRMVSDTVLCANYKTIDTSSIRVGYLNYLLGNDWLEGGSRNNTIDGHFGASDISVRLSHPSRYGNPFDSTYFYDEESDFYGVDTLDRITFRSPVTRTGKYRVKDLMISDTGSVFWSFKRLYWTPTGMYRITTVIDSSATDFTFFNTFLESFQPWDTVLYNNKHKEGRLAFFEDMATQDTTIMDKAMDAINSIKFKDEDAPRLLAMLDTCVSNKNYRVKLRKNIADLEHKGVLNFYTQKFYAAGDTTSMQLQSLEYIFEQENRAALDTGKRLLLKHTPVPQSSYKLNDIFYTLDDSMELTQRLLPDLLDLTDIDEYKSKVYELLADFADSGFAKPGKNEYPMDRLIRDAKNELKKANSSGKSGSGSYYGGYSSGSSKDSKISYDLRKLLHAMYPFRNTNSEVKDFYAKARESEAGGMRIELLKLQFAVDSSVDTSLVNKMAEKEDTRYSVYEWMYKVGKQDLFPKAYLSNDSMIKSIIKDQDYGLYSYDKDSVVSLTYDSIELRNTTGLVHYFKIYKNSSKKYEYGALILLPGEGQELTDRMKVIVGLGEVKEDDKQAEKFSEISEKIAIEYYEGVKKSYGFMNNLNFDLGNISFN
ncbi:MAG: TraB/GumN family protein [Bacteroidetes bacterium]|nr:MAG: TraB/GumN family protein [Bacteroidota bacterium]